MEATKIEPIVQEEAELSTTAYFAQCMSRPVNLTEYVADKVIGGIVTSLCYIGITKGIEHYRESRALRRQSANVPR